MATHDSEQLGEWLSAYADGELDAVEVQRVEAILQESDEARRVLEEVRRTASLVAALPRHDAPPSILEELRLHAEREELLGDLEPQPVVRSGGRGWLMGILSTAALLTIVVGGGWYLTVGRGPATSRENSRVALAPSTESEKLETTDREGRAATRRRSSARPRLSMARREGATGATPSMTVPHPAASDLGRTADTLLAEATIDQKLRAGLDIEVVRDHSFANETIQLEVEVTSEAERDRVMAHLATYLSDRRVADVSGKRRKTSSASPRRFFYAGTPNKNFARADDREIIVRATKGDLRGLVEQAATATGREDRVVLVAGPLKIHGSSEVQRTLDGLARSPVATARRTTEDADVADLRGKGAITNRPDKPKRSAAPDEFIASLIDMLGLDDSVTSAPSKDEGTKLTSTAEVAKAATQQRSRKSRTLSDAVSASTRKPTKTESAPTEISGRKSLVSRRADALRKSSEKRSSGVNAPRPDRAAGSDVARRKRPTSPETASSTEHATTEEPVVTLVVRVKISKPTRSRFDSPTKTKSLRRPPVKPAQPKGEGNHGSW